MVQIWMRPSAVTAKKQTHKVLRIKSNGITPVYGVPHDDTDLTSDTSLSIIALNNHTMVESNKDSLLYVYEGEGAIFNESQE